MSLCSVGKAVFIPTESKGVAAPVLTGMVASVGVNMMKGARP
jgi:hypothetical protein